MSTMTEKQRDKLPDSKFGLPEEHKYPMPDKAHARNAKARASQQQNAGKITAAKERKIEESVLLNWRLAPDMFAFTRKIQIATDFAQGTRQARRHRSPELCRRRGKLCRGQAAHRQDGEFCADLQARGHRRF